MTFKNIHLKETYDSDEDNVLNDFYIPALSNAVHYDRLAGYFSSTSLAASAKGMADFLQKKGTMRLITCVQIPAQDYDAIKQGITHPEKVIEKIILDELDVAEQIQKDHVAALAWMIAKKLLEIKIAVPLKDGNFFTEQLDTNSIFHQKIGILYDEKNNKISFGGSINETGKAWTGNIEEFKVFCSWKPGHDVFGSGDARKFEKFWYGQSVHTRVFDLPTAVKKHLITIAPSSVNDAIGKLQAVRPNKPTLRTYQNDAVAAWFANNKTGIFEMATGTGKTWTAISCLNQIFEDSEPLLAVIVCPYKHLLIQWEQELTKWNLKSSLAYGSVHSWQIDLNNRILNLNDGVLKHQIIITTHDTFSSKQFMDMIKICQAKSFLIVDEVHKIGSKKRGEGLLDEYTYRLGLSATPERYFDSEGTQTINNFFDKIVFKYDLDEAIKNGHLAHYHFYPHVVYMTEDESTRYHSLSKSIAIEYSKEHPNRTQIDKLKFMRSIIIKSAENKIDELEQIIKNVDLDHCLIYCGDNKQLKTASSKLHDAGILYHRFTEKEEDPEYRDKLLDEFARGDKKVLLAIKCLDEGVDIPSTKTAIILASSQNPIEFIQRRGRILRIHADKTHAIIHDFIVFPRSLPSGEIYTESEKNKIRTELERIEEFASSSDNPDYSHQMVTTFMKQYNL